MTGEIVVSAGIDIGTSTTHLTISKLKLQNISTGNRAPKLSVVERTVIFQSKIYATPLNADGSINSNSVAQLIRNEYELANVSSSEIQTGAVIITGETAKLRNAREVSSAIADLAGDFVIASAGAHLEGLLAGRGAGAEEASRHLDKTICNIDIGGGTSNLAVFRSGRLLDSSCLSIGGRCIQFDKNGKIVGFTESAETFLDGVAKLKLLPIGSVPDKELVELVASLLAEVILHAAFSPVPPQIVQRLLNTEPLKHDYAIDEYWFSGGVAECMQKNFVEFQFGDLGTQLAEALHAALRQKGVKYKIAGTGIRATVIGAGMHSLQVSGCTIFLSENVLPLRNVRIVQPFAADDATAGEDTIIAKLKSHVISATGLGDSNDDAEHIAIALCDLSKLSYEELRKWARALYQFHADRNCSHPLIVLSKEDIGLALGQTLRQLSRDLELVILDDVDIGMGDYIDVGKPLGQKQSVALTVKTLIFH